MDQGRQSAAAIEEFRQALEDDRFELAQRIRRANPDLEARFQEVLRGSAK